MCIITSGESYHDGGRQWIFGKSCISGKNQSLKFQSGMSYLREIWWLNNVDAKHSLWAVQFYPIFTQQIEGAATVNIGRARYLTNDFNQIRFVDHAWHAFLLQSKFNTETALMKFDDQGQVQGHGMMRFRMDAVDWLKSKSKVGKWHRAWKTDVIWKL